MIMIMIQDNPVSVISTGVKGGPVIKILEKKNTKSLKGKNTRKL